MGELIHGVIHGRTIELQTDPGLGEGQPVEVLIRPAPLPAMPDDGIRRSAGALTDDAHWDSIMDEIYQSRQQERRPHAEVE